MLLINEQSTIIYDTNLLITEAENQPPIANADSGSLFEDGVFFGNVLSNDSDPDGDPIIVTSVNGFADAVGIPLFLASGAIVIVNEDGSYFYDPNDRFNALNDGETATDSFAYTISDSTAVEFDASAFSATDLTGGTNVSALATGQINAGNVSTHTINGKTTSSVSTKPPIVVDDTGTVRKNEVLSLNLLANDSNPEGGNFSVFAISGFVITRDREFISPLGAKVTIEYTGAYSYNPNGQFNNLLEGQTATEGFTYTVVNNGNLTATANITVTIQGFNDLPPGFDPAQYGASNPELIPIFRNDLAGLTNHYLLHGRSENRPLDNFDEFRYIASSYPVGGDLIKAYGLNGAAATQHYLTDGFFNGRSKTAFDPARYLDSYPDLINAPSIGTNTLAATQHFITSGFFSDGRNPNLFPSDRYLASHVDLINAYKSITDYAAKVEEASKHYLISGRNEPGRQIITFDPLAYMAKHSDVAAFAKNDPNLATFHYITVGFSDGHTP